MALGDDIRAFRDQYVAQNLPPEGEAVPFAPQSGSAPGQDIRDFAAQWAMQNAPQEGAMRGLEIRDFASDYQADVSYMDEFGRGVSQGTDMLQASLYAMTKTIGRELGIEALEGFGERGMQANIEEMSQFGPTQARFSQIDSMDDFFRWAAGAFGQALPSLGTAMAGGGFGGLLVKKGVERSIYKVVRDRMLRQMKRKGIADDAAEAAVARALNSRAGVDMLKNGFQDGNARLLQRGFARGSAIGAMIPSSAMQAGETEMTLSEAGIDGSLAAVFGAGIAGGSLEALPALRLIDRMFPGVDKKVAGSFISDFAKATGTQAVLEGSTEGAQEMIQLASLAWHDPSFDLMNPENGLQVLDAFAAGALVGAVTGGAGEIVGRGTGGAPDDTAPFRPNLPGGPKERVSEVDAPEVTYPEDFEPADNSVFDEVKGRAQKVVDETLKPALNKIGSTFNGAQDRADGVFLAGNVTPYAGATPYRLAVQAGQDEFIAGHEPVLADTVRYARDYAMWLAEEAADIDPSWKVVIQQALALEDRVMTAANIDPTGLKGPDKALAEQNRKTWQLEVDRLEQFKHEYGIKGSVRENLEQGKIDDTVSPKTKEFIEKGMVDLQEEVGKVATELGMRGDKIIGALMQDIESDPIMDDLQAPPDPDEVETEFEFGQMFAYRDDQNQHRTYRTRWPNARPYPTYEQAADNLESVMEKYPSAPPSAWSIREVEPNEELGQPGGFTIAINDSGLRTQLREDEVVFDAVTIARVSARGNPDKKRHVTVKLPNRKTNVTLDLPTLVYEGRRLNDGDGQTLEQAFEAMMARMFARRALDDQSYQVLREAFEKQFKTRKERRMTLKQWNLSLAKRREAGAIETSSTAITRPPEIQEELDNLEMLIYDYERGQFSGQPESANTAAELREERAKLLRKYPGNRTVSRTLYQVKDKDREKAKRETFGGDLPGMADPGVVSSTGYQYSYRKNVKGSSRVTPRAEGKGGKDPRYSATGQLDMSRSPMQDKGTPVEAGTAEAEARVRQPSLLATPAENQQQLEEDTEFLERNRNFDPDVRSQGRAVYQDDDPEADSRGFAAQVEKESKGKLPSETQQAQQSLLDVGGLSRRRDNKRDHQVTGPLSAQANRLKSAMAKMPRSKDRTKEEQAEFEEMAWALNLLERSGRPKNAQQNNRLKRILDKAGKYTTSGTDPSKAGSLAPKLDTKARDSLAKRDPEGTKTKRLKPKKLAHKWIAVAGSEMNDTTAVEDSAQARARKENEARIVQAITNEGYHVDFSGGNKKAIRGVKWVIKKVGRLMPNVRIIVADRAAVTKWRDNGANRELSELAHAMLRFPSAAVSYLSHMDTAVIMVNDLDKGAGNFMTGLIHELGHVIHYNTWVEMGHENQKKLWEAFKQDVAKGIRASGAGLQRTGTKPWNMNLHRDTMEFMRKNGLFVDKRGVTDKDVINQLIHLAHMRNGKRTTAIQNSTENLLKMLPTLSPEQAKQLEKLIQRYQKFVSTDERRSQVVTEPNIFEFKEWMADQFVIWMNNRRKPRNMIERFFHELELKLKEFYDMLRANPGRYGMPLNETYAEFADAVARRAAQTGDPATDRWFPVNKIGLGIEALWGRANSLELQFTAMQRDLEAARTVEDTQEQAEKKTNKAKLTKKQVKIAPYKGLEPEEWAKIIPKELTYNEIIRSGKQLQKLIGNLYDVAMAPSVSVMRSLGKKGITAADQLADIFSRQPGQTNTGMNYHQQVKRMSRGFLKRYNDIVKGLSVEQKLALREDLISGNRPNGVRQKAMRVLLNDMHRYFVKAGLPIGKIENYVPKMFNKQLLLDNEEAIIQHYYTKFYKENEFNVKKFADKETLKKEAMEFARKKFNGLTTDEAARAAAEEQLRLDELSMQHPGFQAMRHRYTQSRFMNQFLETDLDNIMANYINQGVKRAEYNRRLGEPAQKGLTGGDILTRKMWNPQGKLEAIMDEAKAQGATEVQLMRMKNFVDAQLGMYGRDEIGEKTRKFMAGMVAYQNMRVLLFTVFASLPDMMGPVIRSNDGKLAFKAFSKNMRDIITNASHGELVEMAEALGIITDNLSQHVLTEYVDNHYMPQGLRKWNDRFFKYTGLNWYTDATRKYALAVGIKSLENAAEQAAVGATAKKRNKAKKFLKEFGLTPEEVMEWVAAGKPIYNSSTYNSQTGRRGERDDKIAAALVQFVDEAIMSPNPAQRPIAASHPGLMLVYHLKGFMYAIYDVFLKRMKYNWDNAKTVPEHIGAAAPALGMMVLTAVGIELRDLITGNDTKGRMDGWEYTWTLVERAGLLGPAQLGWDFEGAGDFGQSELVALSGPSLSHAGDLISRPLSQTIPKSIPVASQLPWMRSMLRGDFGGGAEVAQ